MMEEFGELYIKNSIPLKRAENLVIGEEYFCKAGHCYKYLGKDEFEFIKRSPLVINEQISSIKDPHVLKSFWALSKNLKG